MDDANLYEEIFTVAQDLYERSGRIEGRELNNWLEAERIVRTLWKIAGKDGRRYILVNVPKMKYGEKMKNGNHLIKSRKKLTYRAISKSPKTTLFDESI